MNNPIPLIPELQKLVEEGVLYNRMYGRTFVIFAIKLNTSFAGELVAVDDGSIVLEIPRGEKVPGVSTQLEAAAWIAKRIIPRTDPASIEERERCGP